MPAPIDVQVSGSNLQQSYDTALAAGQTDPQDPGRRRHLHSAGYRLSGACSSMSTAPARGELGLTQKEVVGNIITALTSNAMIAPSFWIDPKTGNDYMLTVQYPERQIQQLRRPAGDSGTRQEHCHIHAPGCGFEYPPDQVAHRSGPLPIAARDRHLRAADGRRPGAHRERDRRAHRAHHDSQRRHGHAARPGAGHAAELSAASASG